MPATLGIAAAPIAGKARSCGLPAQQTDKGLSYKKHAGMTTLINGIF
jgi:hypothetical protein